jgi:hypothetical protein
MTIVQRNTSDSEKRSYASIAAIPAAIPVVPVAVQNSFSALQDDSSESELDLAQFVWKSVHTSSESEESDSISYDSATNSATDSATDSAEDSAEDSANDNSAEDSGTDSSSDSSQDDLIVNQKHYRRVRHSWCKDGIPCFVTSLAGFLALAYFMQFVFYMCGFINDDCSSPAGRLQYNKYNKGL